MTNDLLSTFSNQLADAVAAAAPSVVQVQGRRRPASGLVYADDVVLTTARALGREDGLHVRRHDGRALDAELAGWDPTTSLAVLRVAWLETPTIDGWRGAARRPPRARGRALVEQRHHRQCRNRVGDRRTAADRPPARHRRSDSHDRADARWLRRRRVPRHRRGARRHRDRDRDSRPRRRDSGADRVADCSGRPRARRRSAGTSGLPVSRWSCRSTTRYATGARKLLVVGVTAASPAAAAGVLVGDVLVDFDGHPIESPDDLLDLLVGDRVGRRSQSGRCVVAL